MTPEQHAYNRVYAWIDSCQTDFQFEAAQVLIELFEKMFGDEEMVDMLHQLLIDKIKETHDY